MDRVLQAIAGLVLLLFAAIWVWIGFELLLFQPTEQTPSLTFDDAQVTVAGFLSSAVGAGTASVLGIEIQRVGNEQQRSLAQRVNTAIRSSWLLVIGVLLYAAVGVFVLLVWLFNSGQAPDMVGAFSLGVLGWLGGALTAVFSAANA